MPHALAPQSFSTQRLTLRQFTLADHAEYARITADPEVTRYIGAGQPYTPEIAWRVMAGTLGHWQLLGYGMWAVTLRDTGRLIGHCGYIDVYNWPSFELGWLLGREHWNQGYAREAAAAQLAIAQQQLRKERIISLIRPQNAPSIKLARSLGARMEGTVELMGAPAEVHVHRPGGSIGGTIDR